MNEQDRLLIKKNELEQLIKNNEWGTNMSGYASHPADMTSHMEILNIELERINDALAQYYPEQLN